MSEKKLAHPNRNAHDLTGTTDQTIRYNYHPAERQVVPLNQIDLGNNGLGYSQDANGDITVRGSSGLGVGAAKSTSAIQAPVDGRPIPTDPANMGFPSSERPDQEGVGSRGPSGIAIPIPLGRGVQVTPYVNPFGGGDVGVVLNVNIGAPMVPARQINPSQNEIVKTAEDVGMNGLIQRFRAEQNIRMNGDGKGNLIINSSARVQPAPVAPDKRQSSNPQDQTFTTSAQDLQGTQALSSDTVRIARQVTSSVRDQVKSSTNGDIEDPNHGLITAMPLSAKKSQQL